MSNVTRNEKLEKLFDMIEDIEFAMLVTQTASGSLRSRPMATRVTENDDCLWFLTDKDSAKTFEIDRNREVNVSFAKPDDRKFVSVSGIASITDDQGKIDDVWTPTAQIWFPEGKTDPRLTLIKVEPTIAEYWDEPRGVYVNLYEITKSIVTGERPDDEHGENEKINM